MVWSVLSYSANTLTESGSKHAFYQACVLQVIVVLHTGYDLWLWLCCLGQWHMKMPLTEWKYILSTASSLQIMVSTQVCFKF